MIQHAVRRLNGDCAVVVAHAVAATVSVKFQEECFGQCDFVKLDIYTWLAWRLPALKGETRIGWIALKAQLGGGATLMKNFKPHFRTSLLAAHAVYREANLNLTEEGLILKPSPPPMPPRKRTTPYSTRMLYG